MCIHIHVCGMTGYTSMYACVFVRNMMRTMAGKDMHAQTHTHTHTRSERPVKERWFSVLQHTHTHTHINAHIHKHIHTHTNTTQTYTHTHTHIRSERAVKERWFSVLQHKADDLARTFTEADFEFLQHAPNSSKIKRPRNVSFLFLSM